MFFKKTTKINKFFTIDLSVKPMVKILSIFVALLVNMNYVYQSDEYNTYLADI